LSFIEKNKVWLLPLLGLGVLGVVYMNFRTLQGDKPENAAPPVAEAAAAPGAAEAPPAPAPEAVPPDASTDLWADLQAFAVLPGNLAQAGPLRDRARLALGPELGENPLLTLEKPTGAALAKPAKKPLEAGSGASEGAPPELDFLIHGPKGSFAWFDGRAYRAGESLPDGGYTVSRIGPTYVELSGPRGMILEYANPIHPFDKKPSTPAEAP
jgi:hypothetical protein